MVSHWKVNLEILLIAVLLHHGHGTSSMDCNFDMGWCNWANERQNCFNWTIGYGKSWDRTSGPDADHTTNSSSGLYAVVLGRHSMNSTCTAIIQSPSETFDQKKISFWYHMNGNGIGHLAVFVVENNVRRRIWYREARQGAGWQEASVPLTKGNYMIQFEGTSKLHFGGDLAIDDILIIPDTGPQPTRPQLQRLPLSLPVHCTFDSGNCGFDIKNKYSSVSWTVQKGFISVDNVTYITGDNTTGNGEFLAVVSGKHSMIGDKSTLSLPLIRPQNMTCLTFSYNLPSSTSGYIKVFTKDINTGIDMLLWQKTGYQGRIWKHGSVQIYPSHDLQQVVLEGACTGEPACIIAVDDVNLETGTCKDFHPTTTSSTTTTTVTTATTTTQPTTTTKGTTTQPPTTQLPGLSFKSATSCHPVYTSFIPELSCDFTNSFCNYTQTDINIDWEIKNKQYGGWLAKIPARNTSDGDYLALNLSTYQIKTGEAILKSPLINQDAICVEFWYSMPSFSSNLKMEVESSNGGKTTIWKKSGSQNHGMWTKESLLVNYNSKYKLAFLGDKTTSISFVGIDDIHVYGKGKGVSRGISAYFD